MIIWSFQQFESESVPVRNRTVDLSSRVHDDCRRRARMTAPGLRLHGLLGRTAHNSIPLGSADTRTMFGPRHRRLGRDRAARCACHSRCGPVTNVESTLRSKYAELEVVPVPRCPATSVDCIESAVGEFDSHHEGGVRVEGAFVYLVVREPSEGPLAGTSHYLSPKPRRKTRNPGCGCLCRLTPHAIHATWTSARACSRCASRPNSSPPANSASRRPRHA
jgi:hypothetical protein